VNIVFQYELHNIFRDITKLIVWSRVLLEKLSLSWSRSSTTFMEPKCSLSFCNTPPPVPILSNPVIPFYLPVEEKFQERP
jgi:hypothetical protein